MTDLHTLTDAFAELERRADATLAVPFTPPSHPSPSRRARIVLVAASVAAVLALAGGAVALSGWGDSEHQPAGTGRPSSSAPIRPTSSTPPPPSSSAPTPATKLPRAAAVLAHKLRAILGKTATVKLVDGGSTGAFITGTLTMKASGRSGGFDLQMVQVDPGDKAMCEDTDTSDCTIRRLPDGSSLSVGQEPVGRSGVLYLVNLVRQDGVALLMHVSNARDPKSGDDIMSAKPPLSRKQIVALLRSDRW